MKNLFAFLSIITLLFSACKTEDITPNVQFLEHNFFGNCFTISWDDKEVIIRSEQEYNDFFVNKKQDREGCASATPTAIDFDKYTLIGALTQTTGCSDRYERQIDQKGNKELTYTVKAISVGACLPLRLNMNWALIPKIKNRTDVHFEIEEAHEF